MPFLFFVFLHQKRTLSNTSLQSLSTCEPGRDGISEFSNSIVLDFSLSKTLRGYSQANKNQILSLSLHLSLSLFFKFVHLNYLSKTPFSSWNFTQKVRSIYMQIRATFHWLQGRVFQQLDNESLQAHPGVVLESPLKKSLFKKIFKKTARPS